MGVRSWLRRKVAAKSGALAPHEKAEVIAAHEGFIEDYTADVARGVTNRPLKAQTAPHAQWMAPETLLTHQALSYNPERPGAKILVGAIGARLIGIEDNRHILTVAGSRTGKSVTLIANLLHYRGSVLATDPKGELANITAEQRAALGQRVHVLDPFNVTAARLAPFRSRFNPMQRLDPMSPTVIEEAGLIADALVIAAGNDPHWDESARSFIEGIILFVAADPAYEGRRTLVAVRDLIREALTRAPEADQNGYFLLEANMVGLARDLSEQTETLDLAGALEGAARDFYEREDRERAAVLSTVRRHTKFLDYAGIRQVLGGHDVDLADLKRVPAGVTIYLCLPASYLSLCNRWLRLFVNQLLDTAERTRVTPPAPVLVALDEFPVLGYMRQLEDAAGQIASFHVKLWIILQDWGQGKALYKDRWETFAGNSGIMQFFGNNDLATGEYISRRLGKTRILTSRLGEVTAADRAKGLAGRSEQLELHDLLTADEVARQFSRSDRHKRQLVIWAGYDPMILQRVEYFDAGSPVHGFFRGRFADRE